MKKNLLRALLLCAGASALLAAALILCALLLGRTPLRLALILALGLPLWAGATWLMARRAATALLRPLADLPAEGEPWPGPPYPELQPTIEAALAAKQADSAGERMRREFTANITHDLKTPLTSISGYAEMIETGLAKEADIGTFAGKIRFESARLMDLIGDILQLSRLDDPAAQSELTPVDLRELTQNAARDFAFAAEKAGLTLTVAGGSATMMGDRRVLEELVHNLCDNAVRYNRPGGSVTLVTGQGVSDVWLRVSDTGIGIPESERERIFERFYRVDKSRSKQVGGTGLGLAIVKHAALRHSAEITLESRENRGTTIAVRFPVQ